MSVDRTGQVWSYRSLDDDMIYVIVRSEAVARGRVGRARPAHEHFALLLTGAAAPHASIVIEHPGEPFERLDHLTRIA